jgi:catalase
MASTILSSISNTAKGAMSSERSKKVQQLAADTKDVHDKNNRITTDYGVKQTNTGKSMVPNLTVSNPNPESR